MDELLGHHFQDGVQCFLSLFLSVFGEASIGLFFCGESQGKGCAHSFEVNRLYNFPSFVVLALFFDKKYLVIRKLNDLGEDSFLTHDAGCWLGVIPSSASLERAEAPKLILCGSASASHAN